jgi:dienelactone hydrolase
MAGQWITLDAADGSGSFRGYLATPASGNGPGLVLAQEIFGVNATMQQVADYYAEEGYTVLVPDLFWRQEPNVELGYTEADWQRAFGFYQGFDEAKGVEDIRRHARPFLRRCPGASAPSCTCTPGSITCLRARVATTQTSSPSPSASMPARHSAGVSMG